MICEFHQRELLAMCHKNLTFPAEEVEMRLMHQVSTELLPPMFGALSFFLHAPQYKLHVKRAIGVDAEARERTIAQF